MSTTKIVACSIAFIVGLFIGFALKGGFCLWAIVPASLLAKGVSYFFKDEETEEETAKGTQKEPASGNDVVK